MVPYALQSDSLDHLRTWVEKGCHGSMNYMAASLDRRDDVRCILPGTKSIVVLLRPYKPSQDQPPQAAPVAAFAWGQDYHTTIKRDLNSLLKTIKQYHPHIQGRAIVDSAPTFEKEWARRAALGWIGKNTLLINPQWGSYTLIGILLLDQEVEPTSHPAPQNQCAQCTKCIDACPTGAITKEGYIDARRCTSYVSQYQPNQTFNPKAYILGCDECLKACPHNKQVGPTDLAPPIELTPEQWRQLGPAEFKTRFSHTPLYRIGLDRIKQNL